MQKQLDTEADSLSRREFVKRTGLLLTALGGATASGPVLASPERLRKRISYFRDGEIYVTPIGQPEGKPLTTGHMDFKPSWSHTQDLLVCFRRVKDDPDTLKWKSAIFVMTADGTDFHLLSDGTRTDFNPTWTRDGKNTPVWNRKNDATGGFFVMQGKVGGKPGDESSLTDQRIHTWVHSCLADGRMLVNSVHPTQGRGLFLLSTTSDGKNHYLRIDCELTATGELHRASISPSEKKICFEYMPGFKFREPGHTLYIADFDAQNNTITNLQPIANREGKQAWYAYPRWIDGEAAVVYHLNDSGKGQLYAYDLQQNSTARISTRGDADYRYPHGEAAPC
jgi:Tol biopolymer transport system component